MESWRSCNLALRNEGEREKSGWAGMSLRIQCLDCRKTGLLFEAKRNWILLLASDFVDL